MIDTRDRWEHGAIGVVGTGSIARDVVTGLSDAPDPPVVWLSPRNAAVAAELASRFDNVRVCPNNEDVVTCSDAVLLAIRPQVWIEAVDGLPWAAGQTVISFVAGVSMEALRGKLAPVHTIARAIPLPSASRRDSVTVTCCADSVTRALFGRLGETFDTENETTFAAFSASTASVAAHLTYLATISNWLAQHGVPSAVANRYVGLVFAGLGGSQRDPALDLNALTHVRVFRRWSTDLARRRFTGTTSESTWNPSGMSPRRSLCSSRIGAARFERPDNQLSNTFDRGWPNGATWPT